VPVEEGQNENICNKVDNFMEPREKTIISYYKKIDVERQVKLAITNINNIRQTTFPRQHPSAIVPIVLRKRNQ
jgi:hypothetical protein